MENTSIDLTVEHTTPIQKDNSHSREFKIDYGNHVFDVAEKSLIRKFCFEVLNLAPSSSFLHISLNRMNGKFIVKVLINSMTSTFEAVDEASDLGPSLAILKGHLVEQIENWKSNRFS